MNLSAKIPEVYAALFKELENIVIPEETIATCSSCTLCQSKNNPYFDTKCCSYFPHLPNYLVGGILSDTNSEIGKNKVENLIKNKLGVTPYGIFPDVAYYENRNIYITSKKIKKTKNEVNKYVCPYLENENCSIWKFRENLCITFFCSSIGGKKGHEFWNSYNEFIRLTEKKVAQFALIQLGWNLEEIELLNFITTNFSVQKKDFSLDEKVYNVIWTKWENNEKQFYIKAYDLVQKLSLDEFKAILGQDYTILTAKIKKNAQSFYKNQFPDYLILNPKAVFIEKNKIWTFKLEDKQIEMDQAIKLIFNLFNGTNATSFVIRKAMAMFLEIDEIVEFCIENKLLIIKK